MCFSNPSLPFSQLFHLATRFHVYKQTMNDGLAPCAPSPPAGKRAFLTLALCKYLIRRGAKPGDVIIGLAGKALSAHLGCPENAVIWIGVVSEVLDGKDYYTDENAYRLDCIYRFIEAIRKYINISKIHHGEEKNDVGRFPAYENARIVVCREFRYFGPNAPEIPVGLCGLLRDKVAGFARGHSIYDVNDMKSGEKRELGREAQKLLKHLWTLPGAGYTPSVLERGSPRFAESASEDSSVKNNRVARRCGSKVKGNMTGGQEVKGGYGVKKGRVGKNWRSEGCIRKRVRRNEDGASNVSRE